MDPTNIVFALLLATVALTTPFGLRFDQSGLGNSRLAERGRRILFAVMALLFGTGFVGLAAVGAGAMAGLDGIAMMLPLAWLWGPLLVVSTALAARRGFGGRST